MRRAFTLLALCWIVLAPAAADDTLEVYGLSFPMFVERLARAEQNDFESRAPGLGISVSYRGGNPLATVYVYDRKIPQTPADPGSPVVQQEMTIALDEIQQAVRAGAYTSA